MEQSQQDNCSSRSRISLSISVGLNHILVRCAFLQFHFNYVLALLLLLSNRMDFSLLCSKLYSAPPVFALTYTPPYCSLLLSFPLYCSQFLSTQLLAIPLNSTPLYCSLLVYTLLHSTSRLLLSTLLNSTFLFATPLYATRLYCSLLLFALLHSTALYSCLLYSSLLCLLLSTLLHSTVRYSIQFYCNRLYTSLWHDISLYSVPIYFEPAPCSISIYSIPLPPYSFSSPTQSYSASTYILHWILSSSLQFIPDLNPLDSSRIYY